MCSKEVCLEKVPEKRPKGPGARPTSIPKWASRWRLNPFKYFFRTLGPWASGHRRASLGGSSIAGGYRQKKPAEGGGPGNRRRPPHPRTPGGREGPRRRGRRRGRAARAAGGRGMGAGGGRATSPRGSRSCGPGRTAPAARGRPRGLTSLFPRWRPPGKLSHGPGTGARVPCGSSPTRARSWRASATDHVAWLSKGPT